MTLLKNIGGTADAGASLPHLGVIQYQYLQCLTFHDIERESCVLFLHHITGTRTRRMES